MADSQNSLEDTKSNNIAQAYDFHPKYGFHQPASPIALTCTEKNEKPSLLKVKS